MIKEFLAKKSIGFYLMAASVLCALLSIITYSVGAQDTYGFDAAVVVLLVISVAAGALFLWKDFFGAGPIVVSTLMCAAAGVFINARFMYFSYVYYGVGIEQGLSAAMVFTIIFLVGMVVTAITSAFFKPDKADKEA